MTNDELKAQLAQLAEENERLREALKFITSLTRPAPPETLRLLESRKVSPIGAYRLGEYNAALIAQKALQPLPTNTGKLIMDVVRAAEAWATENKPHESHATKYFQLLNAVEAYQKGVSDA
jgi:hypothetical protein